MLLTTLICSINPAILSFFFDSDDYSYVVLALLLSGPIFFAIMYTRYRNTDKRHSHEKETKAEISELRQYDNFVECKTRQNSSMISGANSTRVEGSIVKGGSLSNIANSYLKKG